MRRAAPETERQVRDRPDALFAHSDTNPPAAYGATQQPLAKFNIYRKCVACDGEFNNLRSRLYRCPANGRSSKEGRAIATSRIRQFKVRFVFMIFFVIFHREGQCC